MNKVKESEEWACFSCKPEQISNLKVKWKALYDYIEEEIRFVLLLIFTVYVNLYYFRLANECNEPERLSIDYSCCCNDEMAPVKRKFTVPVHSNEYIDTIHTNKKTKLDNSTKSYSETNENTPPPTNIKSELNFLKGDVEDEIICTPDLYLPLQNSEYRDTEETVLPQNASVAEVNPFIPFPSYSQPSVAPAVQPLYYSLPPLPKSGPSNMRNAIANHKTNAVVPNIFAHKPLITNPPIPKLLYFKKPIIKCNIKKKRAIEKNQTIDKQSSSKPVCNLNYDWFQNAFKNTTAINQNLTKILSEISKTPQTISSIEGYTQLHNKYQEILQNTIISLKIIARKLQTDFISDLKKMKFHAEHNAVYQPYSNNSDEDIIVIDADSSISEQSKDKLATENVLGNIAKINSTAFLQSLLDGKFENKMSENRMIEQCMNLTESSANSDNAVNNDIQISKAEQPNKDSSEISDNMKSKRVIENKFESIYKENLNIPTRGIEPNELKRMISVRVMVTTNYDPTIPKMKYFNKFNITK